MTQGPGTYLNLSANGNILPMSFVKLDPAQADSCLQCTAGGAPIGVSGTWTRYAGGTPANDDAAVPNLHAVDDEFPLVASIGCVVPIVAGNAATWTTGQHLKADALGYATACVNAGDIAGAIALEPSSGTGVHARCLVIAPVAWATAMVLRGAEEAQKAQDEESKQLDEARKAKAKEAREQIQETLTPTEAYAQKAAREQRKIEAEQAEEYAKTLQEDMEEEEQGWEDVKTSKKPATVPPTAGQHPAPVVPGRQPPPHK